jgi:hypothetical protein
MKKNKTGLIFLLLFFAPLLPGQTVIGQYEEEAPLRTWNILGFVSAAGLGRGNIMTVIADSPAVALSNPALLLDLPRFCFFLNGSTEGASLFRFALVNTGVLHSTSNLWAKTTALDGGGLSLKLGGWALSFGVAITEYFDRPSVRAESLANNQLVYELHFGQEGFLRTWNMALARTLGRGFAIGLGLNYATGTMEIVTNETWIKSGLSIKDEKKSRLSEFHFNWGLSADISQSLRLTISLQPPHRRHKNSSSLYEYSAPAGKTSIVIQGEAEDSMDLPLILSVGSRYFLGPKWWVCGETNFFSWSKYKLTWFGEEEKRNFRDVIRFALAIENMSSFFLFGQPLSLTSRVGVQVDPQPMKAPRSTYTGLSSGLGLRWKYLRLDFGASWGQEKGSGKSLQVFRSSLSLTGYF